MQVNVFAVRALRLDRKEIHKNWLGFGGFWVAWILGDFGWSGFDVALIVEMKEKRLKNDAKSMCQFPEQNLCHFRWE